MAQNISARRGAAIAGFAALVLLALLAAFDNQWTQHWRNGRSAENGNAAHSWIAGPVRGLSALAWRATKESGEPSRLFYGMLAEPVIAVVLTFLLLMLVCRGVGAERGRWSLFLGSWFVTGLAASIALIAGSAIAGLRVAAGLADDPANARFGRGDIYYALIALGLAFGLFAGWLVGFVAVLVYGSTEGGAQEERATREYPSPAMDYSDYSPSSVSSSSASPGSPDPESASEDYSFSPTSPYSSGDPTPGYSGYESANAATETNAPPQERDPYGGARPY
ncbi:hypothetical protein KGQ19_08205 [Catenulispora sp. NL8]|uniref:Uncharacterized protein n=1 Tax=Catenulispora pinistramenti TaxID=2705254 RepID=A0ABS5KLE5_9ACTN|nr:hypothetical protein [Catenulispora pinistramenti]MBS2546850.1 hypothetical protein [Catenulispora pinistramenti]